MAENTKTEATETESKAPTAEELKVAYDSLPAEFKQTINDLNAAIKAHNANVNKVVASEATDPKLIKAEIFEQNPDNNTKLARLRVEELKHLEAAEKIRTQAYEVIEKDGLMPRELTEEEVTKLKASVTESTKNLRDQASTLAKFEDMMPMFKNKLVIHLEEIKTRRGTGKVGGAQSAAQTGVKRPRFKKILVNGSDQETINGKTLTVWGEANGEQKYTMTFLSKFLKAKNPVLTWTAKDLQDAYFGDKSDQSEIEDERTFVMTHEFKDEAGNTKSVNYEITAIK
jgi:hypothetical protein